MKDDVALKSHFRQRQPNQTLSDKIANKHRDWQSGHKYVEKHSNAHCNSHKELHARRLQWEQSQILKCFLVDL